MKLTTENFSLQKLFSRQNNAFLKGILPGPGFTVEAQGLSYLDFEIVDTVWRHPATGIEAEINYSYFKNSNVLELSGTVFNRGKKTVKNLKGPFSLYFNSDITPCGKPQMTSVYGGSSTNGAYPPRSMLGGREGGRSTETNMPYVILTDSRKKEGMFYTLEWPCRWIICSGDSMQKNKRIMRTMVHVAYTGFDLKPGQSCCLPKADLGFFKGSSIAGSNALRRHITENVRRPIRGGSSLPPVFYNHYYGLGGGVGDFNAGDLKKEADIYADLGMEYFVVDAGWFKGGFRNGIGNWEIEERAAFPGGMQKFADYVRSKGMKFGFWLEPEFAMKNSDWVKRHPDWF
ncbi:MAG: alpha-galactosidase, partial [Planctomycetota bacterium]